MGAIQNSINQALGVAAALNAPTKALKEQEERQAAAKEAERQEAIKREKTRRKIAKEARDESFLSLIQTKKPEEITDMYDIKLSKANLEGSRTAYNAASNQMSKSYQALYELTGNPKYAKDYAEEVAYYGKISSMFNSAQESLNRKETDLLKAQEANKRAQEIQEAKKELKAQTMKKRQSYLDQPLSIGGKEIGTVKGLPKDMRSQVKEGMKNVR